jgi:hypothetical protein
MGQVDRADGFYLKPVFIHKRRPVDEQDRRRIADAQVRPREESKQVRRLTEQRHPRSRRSPTEEKHEAFPIWRATLAGCILAGWRPPFRRRSPTRWGIPIIVAGAKVEKLFEADCFSEGVSVGPDNGVYFSDITFTKFCKDANGRPGGGHIWRYDPKSGKATIFRSPSGMSNGTKFDRDGNMIVAMGADFGLRVLMKIDMKTGRSSILAGLYEGKPFNALNDISIDVKGRIYFTDPRYLGHEPVVADIRGLPAGPDGTWLAWRSTARAGVARPEEGLYRQRQQLFRPRELKRARRRCRRAPCRFMTAADGTLSNRKVFEITAGSARNAIRRVDRRRRRQCLRRRAL